MAYIEKRSENSYRISVSLGRDSKGNKKIKRKTIRIPDEIINSKNKIQKFVENSATIFENEILDGEFFDTNIIFITYAKKWIKDMKDTNHLAISTAERYESFLPDFEMFFDNKKLIDINVPIINEFYNFLRTIDRRTDSKYIAKDILIDKINKIDKTKKMIAYKIGISYNNLCNLLNKKNISIQIANYISKYFNTKLEKIFLPCKDNKKLTENTILKYHQFLSSVLEEATKSLLISNNPCRNVRKPKPKKKEINYLDIDEAIQLLNKVNEIAEEPFKTLINLYILTGCRRSELLALTWDDIDFQNKFIRINKALLKSQQSRYYIKEPKNKTSIRNIYIDDNVISILLNYKKWKESIYKKISYTPKNNLIFTNIEENFLDPNNITSWLRKFVKKYNLPKVSIHGLRHTNATLLISQGLDVKSVSNRLGHANTTTTLNTYVHPTISGNKKAANTITYLLNKIV